MEREPQHHRSWSLWEYLQRQSWRCPQCKQTWLIIDSSKVSLHTCKRCGYRFLLDEHQPRDAAA